MGILDENLKHFHPPPRKEDFFLPLSPLQCEGNFSSSYPSRGSALFGAKEVHLFFAARAKDSWNRIGEEKGRERRSDERVLGATVSLSDSQGRSLINPCHSSLIS